MIRALRLSMVVAASLGALSPAAATPGSGQALDVTPNLSGVWTADAGVVHFHTMHRFSVTPPPISKVLNTPTMMLGVGLVEGGMLGARYATNSRQVAGTPNEWEVYARWAPLRQDWSMVDGAVRAGWNGTAESADGSLAVARSFGPVRLHVAGRAFSAWRGGDAATAVAAGAVLRLHRWVALAGDVGRLLARDVVDPVNEPEGRDPEPAWSGALQLAIPYSPHTLSLQVTNVNATTLQSSTVGIPDERLWGFEFTVPVTLARYFGGSRAPSSAGGESQAATPSTAPLSDTAPSTVPDTVVVSMDNRLRFLPDTVRVRPGQAVRWENPSDLYHTATADPSLARDPVNVQLPDGAETFDSGDMAPGATFTHVFTVPGVYRYVCLPHEPAMMGVVIVEGDSATR